MKTYICAATLALALTGSLALPAQAATHTTTYYYYGSSYTRPYDGDAGFSSRSGYSSAIRKAIDKLDNDPVEDLPIPVLFISRSSITPNFGDPRDDGTRTHEGEDILAPKDSFIVSPTDAVVTRVGTQSSEGNFVNVAAPGGETFIFMHLDKFADGLKAGQVLKPGDLIGYVGNTGNAAGGPTHLHFEIHDDTRKAVDPYPRLTGSFSTSDLIRIYTNLIEILTKQLKDLQR
jgi:murein DD-endopeptidase MepM/ murein hydrolase activator NlpD